MQVWECLAITQEFTLSAWGVDKCGRETKRKFAYWEALHEWVVVVVGCFVGGWTCCVNPHTTPCHLILIPIICVTFIFNVSVQLVVKYCITDDLGGKLVFYYNMTIFPPTHPPTNCIVSIIRGLWCLKMPPQCDALLPMVLLSYNLVLHVKQVCIVTTTTATTLYSRHISHYNVMYFF